MKRLRWWISPERLRWRIADLVNRLPGQCWTGLVDWVLDEPEDRRRGLPWSSNKDCWRSASESRHRACYCGKVQLDAPAATDGGSDG